LLSYEHDGVELHGEPIAHDAANVASPGIGHADGITAADFP
jgi:hypothetical protein